MPEIRPAPVSLQRLSEQLRSVGVVPGSVLLVHTAFSRVGPVEGGPGGLIAALLDVLGPTGTLVMPSMSDEDDVPFDPNLTPCRGMGVVADAFWRSSGVLRSDSPHAFAAIGPKAREILAPHPVDVPHGVDSPVGRVHQLDGQVLLLGVGHDSNTTIHLAESIAGVRYRRRKYVTILVDGVSQQVEYGEIDHCCENFALVDAWVREAGVQTVAPAGHSVGRLVRSRDIVNLVVEQLQRAETTFLHPFGTDSQCDEARASLAELRP